MSMPGKKRRSWVGLLIPALLAFVVLTALGTWEAASPSAPHAKEVPVFAAPSTFRPDVSGPGYWVFTPARLADGKIVTVNRGFVPERRQEKLTREGR